MKKRKVGGNKGIRPEDGKQFSKDYQPPEKWTEKRALALADELIDWMKEKYEDGNDKGNMFYEEFLVIEKDLYPDLIRYLTNKFSSFFERIKTAEKIQELKLQKYGVGDKLNASMTKFVLTNKHGWREKHETQTETNQVKPIEITIVKNDD